MSMLARVLIVGKLQENLDARAEILRHFWSIRTTALNEPEAAEIDADVVVVCETLSEAERQRWVDRIRQESSSILVVKVNGYDSGPFGGADATVDEQHGPGALVSTVYELLTERGKASRAWPGQTSGVLVQ